MVVTSSADANAIVAPNQLIDTPSMVVDEEILHTNIAEMASLAASMSVDLRPHIKTHKTPEIARLQIGAGAIGVTCAKIGEAEVMVEAGVEDVLLAYPTVGEIKIKRLISLMERARIIVALDSHEAAEALSDAMSAEDRIIDVYVEVDTGQNRAGALAGKDAVRLALDFARMPGLRLVGVMSHEGHANTQPPETIEEVALDAGHKLVETADQIRAQGVDISVVSVGSTPAASYTPTVPGVTEMRPGTYVFKDTMAFRYGIYGPDRCAARILATVVSHPAPDRCVVDAGSKTLALDLSKGHPGHGYIIGHPHARIDKLSEEHGVVVLPPKDERIAIGDRVEIIPNHICPSVNLMDELVIVRDGLPIDTWKVAARGKIR
jgi:D-serine deaminase-like pyridoxal phosphate-dependent protein